MATSITNNMLQNPITQRMGDPRWVKYIREHSQYILDNSSPVEVPDEVFAYYNKRPIKALMEMDIDMSTIMIVLRTNGISLVDGMQEHHRVLMIPDEDILTSVLESFSNLYN